MKIVAFIPFGFFSAGGYNTPGYLYETNRKETKGYKGSVLKGTHLLLMQAITIRADGN